MSFQAFVSGEEEQSSSIVILEKGQLYFSGWAFGTLWSEPTVPCVHLPIRWNPAYLTAVRFLRPGAWPYLCQGGLL